MRWFAEAMNMTKQCARALPVFAVLVAAHTGSGSIEDAGHFACR